MTMVGRSSPPSPVSRPCGETMEQWSQPVSPSHHRSCGDAADAPAACPPARPTTNSMVLCAPDPGTLNGVGGSFIKEGSPVYQASIKPTMQPWMALRSNPPASVSQVCATRPDFCGAGQVPGSPPPLACHPGAGTHLHAGDQPVAHCLALGSAGHHLETVGRGCVQQHWGQKGQVTWAQLGWILQTQRPKTAPATTETHHTL